jgi:acetyl esterase
MPLDPQLKAILDQAAASGAAPFHTLSPAEARRTLEQMFGAFRGEPAAVAKCEDRGIPGPGGEIPVRIYTPAGTPPFGVLVFLHGGGWVLGNLETHDATCRSLTNLARCVTMAVDYRLAPEHKFPAAVDDAYAAACWAVENAAKIGGDPNRVAIGGDSAGGNLAAVVTLIARERGKPKLACQMLNYPAVDYGMETQSSKAFSDGYFLSGADMEWFWRHYLRSQDDRRNPSACPMKAQSLAGLPPAIVVTAEFDPLRDEGEAYAVRLREAGVPVTLRRFEGLTHGFISMAAASERSQRAAVEIASILGEFLANKTSR